MSNPSPALASHSSPTPSTTADRKTDLPLLTRNRLLQRIKRALQKGNLFVAAPAGYGKSTLLRSLNAIQPNSYYLALSPADADLDVLRNRLLPILPQAAIVVLDDAHHLVDATETLTWLAEQMQSSTARWVIGGRMIPGLLLDLQLPSEQLGMADLAFGASESKAILRGLDEKLVSEWRQRTEGWPLALALLARQTPGKITLGATLSTRDELFAYLAESVFAALPTELAEFMQISALPLRFNDELLATVFDRPVAEVATLRQEVQRRNLFIEPLEAQGWFKVHDFVRHYLCGQVDSVWRAEVTERLVNWFAAAGDLRMAIEQAIAGWLYERAAQLMNTEANALLFDFGWHQSYKRWVTAMPESIHALFPVLLAKLGFALVFHLQLATEGLTHLNRAQELAVRHSDPNMLAEVHISFAGVYNQIGQMEKALPILDKTVQQPNLPLRLQILAWLRLGTANAFLYRLRDASRAYTMLESIVNQLEEPRERQRSYINIRHNRAVLIAAIRGDFTGQEGLLRQNLLVHQHDIARIEDTYTGLCTLHESLGDWQALQDDLQQIKVVRLQWETNVVSTQPENPATEYAMKARWEMFYWAIHDASQGDFASAQRLAAKFAAEVADSEAIACGQWLQAWLFRCQRRYRDCIDFVDALAPQDNESTRFYRAAIAFERAISALLANEAEWQAGIESHLHFQMQIGAKHYLLRWRILFALAGYQKTTLKTGTQINTDEHRCKAHWRKHATFVLCALKRYRYDRLLIQREPELAAHFWALCLSENIQPNQALAALKEIGKIEPIANLLRSQSRQEEDKEIRLIQALAAIGREEAIPLLDRLMRDKKKKPVMAAIKRALAQLESLPPPKLDVTMLGQFALSRGGMRIDDETWQRPGVRQLFQYFCLQHGRRLTHSQILQDVWPDSDVQSALTAFRLNFSRLRRVLEPNLRSHTPMRYFVVADEIYTFDPQRTLVEIDSERFVHTLDIMLKQKRALNEDQLARLLQTLETWSPPLAELRYTAWAIHTIEHLNERYADGCLLAAQQVLALDRLAEATTWAEQVTIVAPWNEAGWQTLMRCSSQQGQRSMALKVYERAVAALERELGAPPSEETIRLAERLRRDEVI